MKSQGNEHCGIFVRKDKFILLEADYIWTNEHKTLVKEGFGAKCPFFNK